jgi:hypothetical protein
MHALCTLISANQTLPNDPFSLDLTLLGQQNRPHLAFSQLNQFFGSRLSESSRLYDLKRNANPFYRLMSCFDSAPDYTA